VGGDAALSPLLHAWFHTEHRANDMVGFVLSSYFVLYGLTAVAVYQNLTSVTDLVSREAASLGAIYRELGGYPQPGRELLRGELRDYTPRVSPQGSSQEIGR
jgi:hypothetical protein